MSSSSIRVNAIALYRSLLGRVLQSYSQWQTNSIVHKIGHLIVHLVLHCMENRAKCVKASLFWVDLLNVTLQFIRDVNQWVSGSAVKQSA